MIRNRFNFSPKGSKFLLVTIVLIILCSIIFFFLNKSNSGNDVIRKTATARVKRATYTCPMHPSIISDHPDKCPICHMDLQKVSEDEEMAGVPKTKGKLLFYRHPMRSDITSPTPAKDEMGMDYIPVYEEDVNESDSSEVSGRSAFSLSTEKQQLIGVTTTTAEVRSLSIAIRASGKVAFDPDLFTAVEEYKQALISKNEIRDNAYDSLHRQANDLVRSAKTKLKLMGLTDAQIRDMGHSQSASMDLILPKGTVWIYAEVFEYEVAGLKAGQKVEVTAPSIPGSVFTGKVTNMSPIIDSQTRTLRVLSQVPDSTGLLRPNTFVNVKIIVDLGQKLAIPVDSVLHSGNQDFVFVVKDKGKFIPQEIITGFKAGDFYEVQSGLQAGQTLVTAANFLIDSESRLRSTIQQLRAAPDPNIQEPSSAPSSLEKKEDRK
ncbi:MAG: efflux RND transporter periplasmic adaptor subunit [Deltaproteobacteria bacterium]|nr:efflux RND transporter periplasmic adaptor subunit [Deltaproteobacteria bacterium]